MINNSLLKLIIRLSMIELSKYFPSRCDKGLNDFFKHKFRTMCGIQIKELMLHKHIYQPGAKIKVRVSEMCMTLSCLPLVSDVKQMTTLQNLQHLSSSEAYWITCTVNVQAIEQ